MLLAEIWADLDWYTSFTATQYNELACKWETFRQWVKEGKLSEKKPAVLGDISRLDAKPEHDSLSSSRKRI